MGGPFQLPSACFSSYIGGNDTSSCIHSHLHVEDKWPFERHTLMCTFSLTDFDSPNPLTNHTSDVFEMCCKTTHIIFWEIIVSSLIWRKERLSIIGYWRVGVDLNRFESPTCKILALTDHSLLHFDACVTLPLPSTERYYLFISSTNESGVTTKL